MRWLVPFVMLAVPAAAQTAEPTATTATYGAWTVSCAQGAEGKRCQMASKLNLKGEDGQLRPLLDLAIGPAEGGAGIRIAMQVPMDVALRSPVSLSVGGAGADGAAEMPETELVQASYLACLPGGCIADAILTAEALETLKGAGAAKVGFSVLNGNRRVLVPIDLTGFGDAWAALGLVSP